MSSVRAPLQDRARRSLHRMLDATTELLADRPFDEISVDEIVERAGYSKGAFYHRFDSKADLLRHLIRQLTEGALEAWDQFLAPDAWEGKGLAELVEAMVRRLVLIYTRSGNVMRAFSYEVQWGDDDEFRALAARLNRHVAAAFLERVRERSDELTAHARADPEAAVRYWLTALAATLRTTLLWPDPSFGPPASPAEVERRLLRMMVPYLVERWTADGSQEPSVASGGG